MSRLQAKRRMKNLLIFYRKKDINLTHLSRHLLLSALILSFATVCYSQTDNSSSEPLPPPTPAAEYNPKNWKEYSPAEESFSVLLPGKPTEGVQAVDTPFGKLNMHIFTLKSLAFYGVLYMDYPESANIKDTRAFLNGVRDGGLKADKGTLLEEKEIALDGAPGRFLKVQLGNGYTRRTKIYFIKNRVYHLSITTWDKDAPDAIARFHNEIADKFLNSFKLKPAGEEVSSQEELGEVDRYLRDNKVIAVGATNSVGGNSSDVPRVPISGGVLNGKAVNLPQPVYPSIARAAHASGTVAVKVVIDEEGKVIAAQAVSGHPLLFGASVKAARDAQFSTTKLNGKPVKEVGIITYNFIPTK
jgi:TonB family protein